MKASSVVARSRYGRWYCWVVVAIPLASLIIAFCLARAPGFRSAHKYGWYGRSDATYATHGANCEVLIFGDSTAITGLDARKLQDETHLAVCNISQTLGVLSVLGFAPLDRFLENNQKPKFLVLQFAPQDMNTLDFWGAGNIEGVYDLVAFYPLQAAARTFVAHPEALFGLARTVGMLIARNPLAVLSGARAPESETGLPNVFFTLPSRPRLGCDDAPVPALRLPSATWVAEVRSKYGQAADHLLLDVAPTADCDPHYPALRGATAGLVDNRLEGLPIRMFNGGTEHFTVEGSTWLTHALAERIRATGNERAQRAASL
jgi:hypothetical protein